MSGDIQSIPYDLLAQFTTERIDFEEIDAWRAGPVFLTQNTDFGQATFGSAYIGQHVIGQITGKKVDAPLALIPSQVAPANMPEIAFYTGSYNSSTGVFTISPAERGIFMTNSLLGLSISGNNSISRYNWDYPPRNSGGNIRNIVMGLGPVDIRDSQTG